MRPHSHPLPSDTWAPTVSQSLNSNLTLIYGLFEHPIGSDHLLINSQKELIIVNIQGPTQALALPFGTCMCCNTQQQDISHITYSHQFLRHVMSTLNL